MKNKKSKFRGIAMVVVVVMLLQLLTGCSLGKASGDEVAGSDVLQIGIVAKGYGDEFAKQLAKAFQEKTGIKTEVVKSSANTNWVSAQLLAGPSVNDIDIIFDIRATPMKDIATTNYIEGYERAFADLSDIYNEPLEGYDTDKTLKELVGDYMLRACTWDLDGEGYGDGKQYFVSYVSGMEGIVYNKALFQKYNLEEPKTTTELLALMDKIKTLNNGTYVENEDGRKIYPFVYSGKVDYFDMPATVWWAQYEGAAAFNNILQGKDANGTYTADSLKSTGRLSALTTSSKILSQSSGYFDSTCSAKSFTDAQVLFLDNQAFMMITGEWMEREMSGNFSETNLDIAFMRIPVNSDIIMQCDSVKTEEQLVETIQYIDGDVQERPAYLSDTDLDRIKEARSMYCCEGNQHVAYIPAYSNMIDEAKQFFQFMLSKEGQEIMLEYSYGNSASLLVDATKFEAYRSLSSLQKSKYDMWSSALGVTLVGGNYYHPMAYVSGTVRTFYDDPTQESAFGVVETSESFKTPKEFWLKDYNRSAGAWDEEMQRAGVSN